jgi:hypothetical protein
MKKISRFALTIVVLGLFLTLESCEKKKADPTPKEQTENILSSKTWEVSFVTVPLNTATESADWVDFTVTFRDGTMTTTGHAAGAEAVWPSGSYAVSEDGRAVNRGDGIVMMLNNVSESGFTSTFVIVDEDIEGGRLASLDGEYIFDMN